MKKLYYASVSYRRKGDRNRIKTIGAVIAENEEEAKAKFMSNVSVPDWGLEVNYTIWEEEDDVCIMLTKKG